jgi:hypothetical protein
MFYRPDKQPSEALRAQLQERLRTALEFATLGAYEPERTPHPDAPRGPQARVFLFAKVAPACPHGPDPSVSCDAAGADTVEHRGMAAAGRPVVAARRRSRSRRGGTVELAPQPCTWAEPRS